VCQGDFGRLSLGGGFGFGGNPNADPVILSRNGRDFEFRGQTTIRSGAELTIDTSRESLPLSLSQMDEGSWVIFELPGFTTASAGAEQSSLAALQRASSTSYYKDGDTLWVKLVVDEVERGGAAGSPGNFGGGGTSIEVSR
jgi:cell migration-inducing and hyaluronan-binding protein